MARVRLPYDMFKSTLHYLPFLISPSLLIGLPLFFCIWHLFDIHLMVASSVSLEMIIESCGCCNEHMRVSF